MEPEYQHGDVIYIDPDEVALHGRDILVRCVERHDVILKRLIIKRKRRLLKALDPDGPEKLVRFPAHARIIGVVVGKYSDRVFG